MTNTYSTEAALLQLTPKQFPNAVVSQGRLKRSRNTILLASQLAADTVTLLPLPIGHVFAFGLINASATLGSTTVKIGTAADDDFYLADGTFTAAVATLFGRSLGVDDDPSTSTTTPILTFSTATAPSSGTLIVDMYYSQGS